MNNVIVLCCSAQKAVGFHKYNNQVQYANGKNCPNLPKILHDMRLGVYISQTGEQYSHSFRFSRWPVELKLSWKYLSHILRPFAPKSSEQARIRVQFVVFTCKSRLSIGKPRHPPPQWGATDAEIKVPSDESTELKGSPFIAWSRSVYCHACYTYCQGFLPC